MNRYIGFEDALEKLKKFGMKEKESKMMELIMEGFVFQESDVVIANYVHRSPRHITKLRKLISGEIDIPSVFTL